MCACAFVYCACIRFDTAALPPCWSPPHRRPSILVFWAQLYNIILLIFFFIFFFIYTHYTSTCIVCMYSKYTQIIAIAPSIKQTSILRMCTEKPFVCCCFAMRYYVLYCVHIGKKIIKQIQRQFSLFVLNVWNLKWNKQRIKSREKTDRATATHTSSSPYNY